MTIPTYDFDKAVAMLKQGRLLEIVLCDGSRKQRVITATGSVMGRLKHETLMRLYDEVPLTLALKEQRRGRWRYDYSAPSPI